MRDLELPVALQQCADSKFAYQRPEQTGGKAEGHWQLGVVQFATTANPGRAFA